MVDKEVKESESKGYEVVTVATETAEQVVKDGEPISERQLLVDIISKLDRLEAMLK